MRVRVDARGFEEKGKFRTMSGDKRKRWTWRGRREIEGEVPCASLIGDIVR